MKLVGIAKFDCELLVSSKSVISIVAVVVVGGEEKVVMFDTELKPWKFKQNKKTKEDKKKGKFR